jgi:2,3-bisphosphoglycerate-independent phosphoglycerate mutase
MTSPVVLCILDGWGWQPASEYNAISLAETPNWDHLSSNFPLGLIDASEGFVGLPDGQMGNSEVGHMHIGAGRTILQDLPRINHAITTGALEANAQLQDFIAALKHSGGSAHLIGLFSDGGVHAHQDHILALASILDQAGVPVCLHAFLDGRDTPPQSAKAMVETLQQRLGDMTHVRLASLCGRYFAMDRDKRWDRVSKAYNALVCGEAAEMGDPAMAVQASYDAGKGDEFVEPLVAANYLGMKDGDGLLMANFRADRARQLLTALLDPAFDGFERPKVVNFAAACGMVEYSQALNPFLTTIFPPEVLNNTLGEVVSNAGLRQLRIAETEKYAHVTFFLNGGMEDVFAGEERILIPSPQVATYDLQPEMSAPEVAAQMCDAIDHDRFELVVVNFANTDMVGHTGNIPAAIKAVEAVDACVGQLWESVRAKGGSLLITADHGNAECMHDNKTGQAHTAHTLNQVPFVVACESLPDGTVIRNGSLADVAPTVLACLKLPQPEEMTGRNLMEHVRA